MFLHNKYLPFSEDKLKKHFIEIPHKENSNLDKHLKYYKSSIERYKEFENKKNVIQKKQIKLVRQIEKDEKFWTINAFLTFFYSQCRKVELIELLKISFGNKPPLINFNDWTECLNGDLHLFFETKLPSPKSYLNWIKENINKQQLIPYILENAIKNKNEFRNNLEGATKVDAILINSTNGFSIVIEAKVLSDISYQITNDITRNQIVRYLDVILDSNENLHPPLNKRIPENTLFLLTIPGKIKSNPHTRLYGYKYNDYKSNPENLSKELPHRNFNKEQVIELSKRIGWISWEEINGINKNCCNWVA